MSLRAMHSAASGMEAFSFNLDIIANNLANSGTTAYKSSRANFQDLYYQHLQAPGALDSQGNSAPIGTSVGLGTRVSGTATSHEQGALLQTEAQLDVAIVGDGFFQVTDGTRTFYTRSGAFGVNADGDLVLAAADRGYLLEPSLNIPPDTEEISISGDGVVSVRQAGTTQMTQLGEIQLARFSNPQGLMARGENLFDVSDASGQPLTGAPGLEGRGVLRQGFLEASNVEPVRELVELIKTQRHFELSSQVVQAAEETLQIVANLRRI